MTLDDFFTLTEINNGLTDPSRVEELMGIMQKERDCIVKNAGDATRQWSAVGKAISATKNKDCLDRFVQLDGIQFIAKWLKDAQKFSNDLSDTLLEELISLLLQALQKLHLDYEKVVDSEIWTIVEDLLVHNSSKVQDKSRVLFESWKKKRGDDESLLNGEKLVALSDNKVGKSADIERDGEYSLGDVSLPREFSDKEKGQESTEDDALLSLSTEVVHAGEVENAHNSDKNDGSLDLVGSPSLEKAVMEPTLGESCIPAVSRQDTLDGHSEFHELESTDDIKQAPKSENSPEQLGSLGEFNTSEDRHFTSGSDAADAMKSATKPGSQKKIPAGEKKLCEEGSSYIGIRKIDSNGKGAIDDSGSAAKERGKLNHRMLRKSSSSERSLEISKDFGTFLSGIENDGKINNLDQHVIDDELTNDYNLAKKETDREPGQAGKKSDIELDYGLVDPLEVARQVAIEVERDYREQSCSSSEKLPEGNVRPADSPEPQSHASEGPPNEVEDEPDSSPSQKESTTSSANLEAEQTNDTQEMETSQVTETAQEEANTEKGLCNFDLNEEVCSEDTDRPTNQYLTPVSIVSASRAAAAPGLPISPLQFEGNLGWKGSAATSAFRPASPRRVPESDKDLSIGRSNLNFDLNVAENVDARTNDQSESSVETNSRKSERLKLDLNLTSEDGGPPSDWQMAQLFSQGNGHSSSSSSKQPSLRNINLNDQPSFLNDPSDNSYLSKLSQNFNVVKSDDSVISIMGRRVEVNRKDSVPQTFLVPNGRTTPELAFDVNLGRTGSFLGIGSVIPYSNSPVYGYSNVPLGPAMPFSSPLYGSGGPIPYMVDSRGAPVIPQIVGSGSALPTAFSQQPFFLNMTSSNGVGPVGPVVPPQGSFDLNSGMMVGNGSRDPSGFSQFLNSGQLRSMDEHLRSNPQPSISSVVGGKRKEPDNGWENYPSKHYTPPPWK